MNFAQLLFPDFSLILIGYLVCRFTPLDRSVWEKIELLVYYFLFPVLLFYSVVKSPLNLGATSSLIGAAWGLAATGIALSYVLPYLPVLRQFIDRREHAAVAQIGFRFNTFLAFAIAERLAGAEGLALLAVIAAFCIPVFNVAAVWPMARHAERHFARELLRNPYIIATLCGLVANLMGFTMPDWLVPTVSRLGASSLALGLLAAGAGLQLGAMAQNKVLGASVLTIRHFVLPLAAFGLARLFNLSPVQTTALLIFGAVPTSPNVYVLATRMGYDGGSVSALLTISTLLGLFSLPFALGVLR